MRHLWSFSFEAWAEIADNLDAIFTSPLSFLTHNLFVLFALVNISFHTSTRLLMEKLKGSKCGEIWRCTR